MKTQTNGSGNANPAAGRNQASANAVSAAVPAPAEPGTRTDPRAALAGWLAQDDAAAASPDETRPDAGDTAPPTEDSPADADVEQTEAAPETPEAGDIPATEESDNSETETVDLSQDDAESAGDPKGVAKRIGKLKAAHAAELAQREAELQKLRDEIAQAKQPTPAPSPVEGQNPWAGVMETRELDKLKGEFQDFIDWAEENPDGGKYGDREFDHEQIKAMRRNARRQLSVFLPAQERYVREHETAHAQIVAALPELQNPRSELSADAAMVLKAIPQLRSRPDYEYWAAAVAYGHKAIQAELAARNAPKKPVAKPPPAPKAPAASPRPVDTKTSRVSEAKAKVLKEPSRDNLANLMRALG